MIEVGCWGEGACSRFTAHLSGLESFTHIPWPGHSQTSTTREVLPEPLFAQILPKAVVSRCLQPKPQRHLTVFSS